MDDQRKNTLIKKKKPSKEPPQNNYRPILRKCTEGYKLTKSWDQEPNVHGWYQTVHQKWRIGNPNADRENI